MIKQDKENRVSLGLKCGDCIHFDKVAKFETVCALQGIHEKSRAPDCYSADVYKLADKDQPELLNKLGLLIKDMSPSRLRILAYTFKTASQIARHDLKFGQPVYFSLCEDYVSHYFMGYVIGATAEQVYVAARLNKAKTNTIALFYPSTLLTKKEWQAKLIELVKANKVYMPKLKHNKEKCYPSPEYLSKLGTLPDFKAEKFDYEPPTIDNAPAEWVEEKEKKDKEKRKKLKGPKARSRLIDTVDPENPNRVMRKQRRQKPQAIVIED